MNCETCQVKLPTLKTRLNRVNDALYSIGLTYHQFLPTKAIDYALTQNGFSETSRWEFAPRGKVKVHDEVGEGKWISVTAYKMPSGRWEVIAYVN